MADEARAMLDALMGSDRDAELPSGMAVNTSNEVTWERKKRKRSCFDRDIDPLFCAWGIDVYELFKNTKSDTMVGVNNAIVDEEAHNEFKSLPKHEQERLGYSAMLFRKLQDLVQKCDRTVARNKEKLRQEMQRQRQKREGRDLVMDVDETAVEHLASTMVNLEYMEKDIEDLAEKLEKTLTDEEEAKEKIKVAQSDKDKKVAEDNNGKEESKSGEYEGKDVENEQGVSASTGDVSPSQNVDSKVEEKKNEEENKKTDEIMEFEKELESIQLAKQRILVDIKEKIQRIRQLKESIENQRRQLEQVKSDITSDKTVCEVSGNFMSSRDADERIAAHYAGKQYVGWKLVRDKLKEMQKEYGRFGPPMNDRGPPPRDDDRRGGYGGGGYGQRGGGGRNWRGDGRGEYDRDRSRDRHRGGGGGYRRDSSPPRWERDGGHSRGGGDWRQDNRRYYRR
eukprot:CAMPEP_0195307590 /NCGR_PEP_ID=MMETSP0707-20130614/37792_1 /TAXON_ID=33640 /ORGANISM="Asterionellopsis glacialis, Strain CCMP134" /LENGTH=451 /DNA_ID=CAMNT_0040371843 /DNA_START=138 /DNA_END=1493 /DNA_ORIENTATION=+